MILLERELEWRKENERIQFFEPNGKQEEFINIFGSKDHTICTFSASNSLGKTTLLVNILGNLVFGPQNKYFDQEIFKNWELPKRVRYITDPKLVEEISPFHTEIRKWWPRGRYEPIKAGKSYYSQYRIGEWIVDVMSYDQEASQFEGSTLGLAIFDEPPPEELWTPTIRGLRGRGKAAVFMTPLTHAAWYYDKVVPNHLGSVVFGKMEDGCKEHGVRGHLEHSEIQRQIDELMATAPDQVEARVYGKAMYLQGLIYKTFDPKIHILKDHVTPPVGSTLYNVVDPHADKPFFGIWAWPLKNGDVYIIDEHPNEDFFKIHNCQWTLEDYKRMYAQKEQGYTIKRVIDRHFADVGNAATRKTLREELAEIGMWYESSYTAREEIETGVLKVREYLKYNPSKPVNNLNKPKLYINPHCLNTIKAFQRWSIDPKNGKYSDDYKDPMDVLRYLLMADPRPDEPLPPQELVKRYG